VNRVAFFAQRIGVARCGQERDADWIGNSVGRSKTAIAHPSGIPSKIGPSKAVIMVAT